MLKQYLLSTPGSRTIEAARSVSAERFPVQE